MRAAHLPEPTIPQATTCGSLHRHLQRPQQPPQAQQRRSTKAKDCTEKFLDKKKDAPKTFRPIAESKDKKARFPEPAVHYNYYPHPAQDDPATLHTEALHLRFYTYVHPTKPFYPKSVLQPKSTVQCTLPMADVARPEATARGALITAVSRLLAALVELGHATTSVVGVAARTVRARIVERTCDAICSASTLAGFLQRTSSSSG